jgi:transcriptional regulator with XRE-family HTH domain
MAIKGVDSALFDRDDMRRALATQDITTVYRILTDAGVGQRYLAELVGQTQSEVSDILHGRRVRSYDVLVRISEGLEVSRGSMGLAYGDECEGSEPLFEEVTEDMRRRALLAVGSTALFGHAVLGQILEIPVRPPEPTPLPARIGAVDIQALTAVTRALEREAEHWGGGWDVISPVAQRAERLLAVPMDKATSNDLAEAVADLHNVAGWAAFDSHQDDAAQYHFTRAMSLGNTHDGYQFAKATYLAGVSVAEHGAVNDGLKLLQLGQIRIDQAAGVQRMADLRAWIDVDIACALANMGYTEAARSSLASAQDRWRAPTSDRQAEMDWVTALVEMHLNRQDVAERLVTSSVNHWKGTNDRRQAILGHITLAQLHVQAGDSRANDMAFQVIKDVRELRSVRARERLQPMIQALEARSTPDSCQLARMARHVAAV